MNKYQELNKEDFINRNMITRIELPPNFCKKIETKQEENFITTFHKQIATAYVEQIDEIILKSLYELYKGKADEVIVIDEVEFEKFIRKFIPIYLEEKKRGLFDYE